MFSLVQMRSIFGSAVARHRVFPLVEPASWFAVSTSVGAWESNYAWGGGSAAAGESGVKQPTLQSGADAAVKPHNNFNYNA